MNRLSTFFPWSFKSWICLGGKKTIKEHGGFNNWIWSPCVDDPVGHRLDTWGEEVGYCIDNNKMILPSLGCEKTWRESNPRPLQYLWISAFDLIKSYGSGGIQTRIFFSAIKVDGVPLVFNAYIWCIVSIISPPKRVWMSRISIISMQCFQCSSWLQQDYRYAVWSKDNKSSPVSSW